MSTQTRRAYRPGSWYGILGSHTFVLLPPSEKARVAGLWERVDAGAGFDETLDALLSAGLRDLRGFVLVSETEHGTKVVLRGPAVAHLVADGEPVEVLGSTETTWVERLLTGVTRVAVMVEPTEDAESSDPLTVGSGLVRLGYLEDPVPAPAPSHAAAPPVAPEVAVAPPVAPEVAGVPPVASEVDVPALDALTEPYLPAVEEVADEVVEPFVAEDVAQPFAAGEGPGDSGEGSVVPVLEQAPEPVPEPASEPAAIPPPVVGRLLFSSGEVVDVDQMVLVGRAPEARRYTLTEDPILVQVPSPHQEISATHLELRPGSGVDSDRVLVTDLGSTNGTLLVLPGEPPVDLHPGIPVAVLPGSLIDLGDGLTISVVEPA